MESQSSGVGRTMVVAIRQVIAQRSSTPTLHIAVTISAQGKVYASRSAKPADTTQLFRTSNFIGPGYYAVLLFSGIGSIVLLFVLLFSQSEKTLL